MREKEGTCTPLTEVSTPTYRSGILWVHHGVFQTAHFDEFLQWEILQFALLVVALMIVEHLPMEPGRASS
jgi:hypothetical protein